MNWNNVKNISTKHILFYDVYFWNLNYLRGTDEGLHITNEWCNLHLVYRRNVNTKVQQHNIGRFCFFVLHVFLEWRMSWKSCFVSDRCTVFPVKLWTPEKISEMFIVSRPIKCEMKLQKLTAKLQHGLVKTWFSFTVFKCGNCSAYLCAKNRYEWYVEGHITGKRCWIK